MILGSILFDVTAWWLVAVVASCIVSGVLWVFLKNTNKEWVFELVSVLTVVHGVLWFLFLAVAMALDG